MYMYCQFLEGSWTSNLKPPYTTDVQTVYAWNETKLLSYLFGFIRFNVVRVEHIQLYKVHVKATLRLQRSRRVENTGLSVTNLTGDLETLNMMLML